jgi:hypothetical protein
MRSDVKLMKYEACRFRRGLSNDIRLRNKEINASWYANVVLEKFGTLEITNRSFVVTRSGMRSSQPPRWKSDWRVVSGSSHEVTTTATATRNKLSCALR